MAYSKKMEKDELEKLVDTYGLSEVLESLSEICYEKANHVRSNWQDSELAKQWESDAKQIDKVVSKIV